MKVAYLTDDRSRYRQGTYYATYTSGAVRCLQASVFTAFDRTSNACVLDDQELLSLREFDVVIIGHGCVDHFLAPFDIRNPLNKFKSFIKSRTKLIRNLSESESSLIVLSKNDYSRVKQKQALFSALGPDLVITHSLEAVESLSSKDWRTLWFPFATDPLIRKLRDAGRKSIDVGFRSNLHSKWNGGARKHLFEALHRLDPWITTDLSLSENGENFLLPIEYFQWLNSCVLLANTESALGTVGPQFAECFALGVVPVAPERPYEGLLRPDRHYLSVSNDFADLPSKVSNFLNDKERLAEMLQHGEEYFNEYLVDNQLITILMEAQDA